MVTSQIMDGKINVLNELLVNVFDDIVTIEQMTLKEGAFKDLSITEMHTIAAIGMYEPRTMSEVAADLNITVGTLTTAINNLVKKGYVERNRPENDRRIVQIMLTKKGKIAYRIHAKFHSDMVKTSISDLNPEEEDILVRALGKLNNFFKDKYNLLK